MSDTVAGMIARWREDLQGRPRPGLYKTRLRPFCPWVEAMIWMAPALDDEGRKADRPDRLVCMVNGKWADPFEWWPKLREITNEEYEELLANPPADPWEPTVSKVNRNGN